MWTENGVTSSNAGTWMHAMFEHMLNGEDIVPGSMDEELSLCVKFLDELRDEFPNAMIHRTEWVIYAMGEDMAGKESHG